MTSMELDRWIGSILVPAESIPHQRRHCLSSPAPQFPAPVVFPPSMPYPRGLCSLTQEYTYSIIYGFIFHLNTRTVLLRWDAPYMIYPPALVPPCATSRMAALLCGSSLAICIQCVVKSWRNLTATLAARHACQIEVDVVLPCEDASFFSCRDTDFARRCGFFPHSPLLSSALVSSPARMCVVLCGYKHCVHVCQGNTTWANGCFKDFI